MRENTILHAVDSDLVPVRRVGVLVAHSRSVFEDVSVLVAGDGCLEGQDDLVDEMLQQKHAIRVVSLRDEVRLDLYPKVPVDVTVVKDIVDHQNVAAAAHGAGDMGICWRCCFEVVIAVADPAVLLEEAAELWTGRLCNSETDV